MNISPDCRDGNKHKACTDEAWDMEADLPADCDCECHKEGNT